MPEFLAAVRTLLLLRHGQTSWNHERRIQGHTDSQLDELGHAQARAAAKEIAALRPARIWTSDLARAADTADYVAEASGLDPTPDPRLREYALGPRQTMTHAEYAAAHPEEWAEFRRGHFDVVPGGEKTVDVAARTTASLRELLAATAPGELSVAVTHGAAAKVAIAASLGWDLSEALTLGGLDNGCWAILAESPVTGRLRLAAYNAAAPVSD
ncbi:MAG: histidine phosphatase family protein [Actinomycetota bacterium]|nr:histidine phosphatase family protein [Actinomycetota bacterium]